jgi:hypothetical protein
MIQTLPEEVGYQRDKYEKERNIFLTKVNEILNGLLPVRMLSPIVLKQAMIRIDQSGLRNSSKIRTTGIKTKKPSGQTVAFASGDTRVAYGDNTELKAARTRISNVEGENSSVWWVIDEDEENEIHTQIYDTHFSIQKECNPKEVDYVISRIRSFAR